MPPVDLAKVTAAQLLGVGARVRRVAEGRALATTDAIAAAIVDAVFEELAGSVLLVRAVVRAEGGRVSVVGTRGIEPAWNDVARSPDHPLDVFARVPALWEGVLFVDDAGDTAVAAAPRDVVLRYGVRSVVGCGGALPDGRGFAVLVFANRRIPAAAAADFETIGVQARLALLDASDRGISAEAAAAIRADTLAELLRLLEYRYQQQATALADERDVALVAFGERTARSEARLRQSQRALLNVIEDLREARSALEQRVVERTAKLEERNRELEQFAYVASHDLQEPLRTIAGYLQLIEQRYAERLDADGHDFIRFAVEGAHRMQTLIEALLSYSHVSTREIEHARVALDDVVDEVLRSLERSIAEAGATIERRAALPVVRGDRIQLGQLFQNLIANALKFRGEAPAHVVVSSRDEGGGGGGGGGGGERCVIAVSDRGIGFDNRHAERIFAVFRRLQRKYPGTGIGLAICKKIVERHGGTIRAHGVLGQGATFEVSLPRTP